MLSVLRQTGHKLIHKHRRGLFLVLAVLVVVMALAATLAWRYRYSLVSIARLTWQRWTLPNEPQNISAHMCPEAPWMLPTDGILGVFWGDARVPPYSAENRHTGLDIFGSGRENTMPVYAVADGLLTRLPGWKSAVIIQHDDPLRSGEMVWSYYSHMAGAAGRSYIAAEFPSGSAGVPVVAGQSLGYQGVWSGNPLRPGWMHLHFSVVRAAEDGSFLNETVLENTLDPSPYLGIVGNAESEYPNWQPMQCAALIGD